MLEEWWYASGDARKGPVSFDKLRQLLLESKASESTLVWKEGLEKWYPLSEIQELIQAVPSDLPKAAIRVHLIALPLAAPWRRYFARLIDLWAYTLPAAFVSALALSAIFPDFGLWLQRPGSAYTFGWLIFPLVLLIEVGIVSIFGTTLGKALLGLTVTTIGAQRPTTAQYLQRQIGVYWHGLGTGFPFVSLFMMSRQHSRLKAGQQATYDEGKFNVKAKKLGALRALSAAVVVIGILFLHGLFW